MYLIFSSAGANVNYIGLKLCKIPTKKMLSYHDIALHDMQRKIVLDVSVNNVSEIEALSKNKDIKFLTCINHRKEHYNLITEKNYLFKPLQILVEKNQEFVIINWQEKLRFEKMSPNWSKKLIKKWENEQKNVWQTYTKFAIERAVLHWTYKLFDTNYHEVKKIEGIQNFFNFSCFYESYTMVKNEFRKYEIEYLEDEYNDWKLSQEKIFNSWNLIKDNLNSPNKLSLDYQRGLAIALKGITENITEEDCWAQYKFLLN